MLLDKTKISSFGNKNVILCRDKCKKPNTPIVFFAALRTKQQCQHPIIKIHYREIKVSCDLCAATPCNSSSLCNAAWHVTHVNFSFPCCLSERRLKSSQTWSRPLPSLYIHMMQSAHTFTQTSPCCSRCLSAKKNKKNSTSKNSPSRWGEVKSHGSGKATNI